MTTTTGTKRSIAIAIGLAFAAGAALAQSYRWIDEKGQVQYSDTPPPPSAKGVQKQKPPPAPPKDAELVPFELQLAMKDYPVTLYTTPSCKEACSLARDALNARSVPFKEVQVYDEKSNEELKKVSGSNEVPVMTVGSTVQKGFEKGAFDALLDSARYPKAGLLPPGKQAAPPAPADYVSPEQQAASKPTAQPVKPEAEPPQPTGPYAPGAASKPKPAPKPAAKQP